MTPHTLVMDIGYSDSQSQTHILKLIPCTHTRNCNNQETPDSDILKRLKLQCIARKKSHLWQCNLTGCAMREDPDFYFKCRTRMKHAYI